MLSFSLEENPVTLKHRPISDCRRNKGGGHVRTTTGFLSEALSKGWAASR
jgi:hypothetical protein